MIVKNFFNELSVFLNDNIAPISNALDNDSHLLAIAFEQLRNLGGLKLLIPVECGGLGGGRAEWIEYNILLAQYSGALLFLQAQHQFAIVELKKLLPDQSVHDFLKKVADSHLGLGISFAANKKLLHVTKSDGGFIVSGKLPWVTGFHFYSSILLSFDIDGFVYYTLLPFQSSQENTSILISPRIDIAALDSTHTVSVMLNEYYVDKDAIISKKPYQDKVHSEHPAIYNFAGAANALLHIAMNGKYKNNKQVKLNYAILLDEWNDYYSKIVNNNACPLTLRASGFQLAQKCIHFARIACGAESLVSSHTINRITREVWQYTIAGYSEDQLEAYLSIL
ncbi:MAG TPA: acyl-CoA dehydrogenase family protein [Gammaproteobacteria bacterium]|jgi:hypothetical protein|nr:acyl-CoA dehydrogenase family protein [Gammaproteobacteria bacterium]